MKIVFLNVWQGKTGNELEKFIAHQSVDTDIFCLQEATQNVQSLLQQTLRDYSKASALKLISRDESFEQVTYTKKNILTVSTEVIFQSQINCGLGLYTRIKLSNAMFHIINFHGLSRPGDKLDNPDRIMQTETLINLLKDMPGTKVVGGDFNLLPETKSIQTFEASGYQNLIHKYQIETTRNELAWNSYPNNKQYYADYAFISGNAIVEEFSVPKINVSDHLPLILKITA